MPDVLVTLPDSPYPLGLVHDGERKYAGEWIVGGIVQCDGNVVLVEVVQNVISSDRYPEFNRLLGLAGYGPGPLKCGQHKVSRWQTIWSGIPGATIENLTEVILLEAGNAVMTLMAESAITLTDDWEIRPVDVPLLLLGGEGTLAAGDWFPTDETGLPDWQPQDEDAPGIWDPQDEDSVGMPGVVPSAV